MGSRRFCNLAAAVPIFCISAQKTRFFQAALTFRSASGLNAYQCELTHAAIDRLISGDDTLEVTVGGVTNHAAIRNDIENQLSQHTSDPTNVLTTLIDLYALPKDFPGYEAAAATGLKGAAKAAHIEQAWKADIGHTNFHPYIQVHEFEALVLTRPSLLADHYPEYAASIEQLQHECSGFQTPEDINETKATSPSHRILKHIPSYRKLDGFRYLQEIGVPELKAHCPRFKDWLERCEAGFR